MRSAFFLFVVGIFAIDDHVGQGLFALSMVYDVMQTSIAIGEGPSQIVMERIGARFRLN